MAGIEIFNKTQTDTGRVKDWIVLDQVEYKWFQNISAGSNLTFACCEQAPIPWVLENGWVPM